MFTYIAAWQIAHPPTEAIFVYSDGNEDFLSRRGFRDRIRS